MAFGLMFTVVSGLIVVVTIVIMVVILLSCTGNQHPE